MDRAEIISTFRAENPEITERVLTDTVLGVWCKQGNVEICTMTRCIVDRDGTTISTAEDDTNVALSTNISKFFDIDEFPGGGVTYNDKRLQFTDMGVLDREAISWRGRSSGTPKKYYRRGDYIYFDRPIDSEEDDVVIYAVLKPNDFDTDSATPYNELSYLEPFHYGIVKYLQKRAKQKVGKDNEGAAAADEYLAYVKWMKKTIGGSKYAQIQLRPSAYPNNSGNHRG